MHETAAKYLFIEKSHQLSQNHRGSRKLTKDIGIL